MATPTRVRITSNSHVCEQFKAGVLALKKEMHPAPPELKLKELSTYDVLVLWHLRAMHFNGRNLAHQGSVFLPWHRYMLLVFERHMQRVLGEREFAVPYWDWAFDGDAMTSRQPTAPVWQASFVGGTGAPVSDGPFTVENGFRVFLLGSAPKPTVIAEGQGLTRNLGRNGSLPSSADVRAALREPVYDEPPWDTTSRGFRAAVEGSGSSLMHNRVHDWVGGDMSLQTSPNDPVFYLHHSNVDRIWLAWQKLNPRAPYLPGPTETDPKAVGHRLNDELVTLGPRITIAEVLDLTGVVEYDSLDV